MGEGAAGRLLGGQWSRPHLGTPDPYARKGAELTVIDGGNDSDA